MLAARSGVRLLVGLRRQTLALQPKPRLAARRLESGCQSPSARLDLRLKS